MPGVEVLILLAVATVGLTAGRALRLPPIVAYLLAGVLVGQGGVGWVHRTPAVEKLAELGVALLLFGVGVEFSLDRLRRELPRMLASGGTQVVLTTLLTALAFRGVGGEWASALFAGFLVSLSSTAIVFKLYDETGELDAPQGRAAAGILLLQDLALVPMMLLVPVLASPGQGMIRAAATALLTATGAIAIVLLLARIVLPRALELVVRTRVPELFPLAALVAAFGTAGLAARLGLSLPIGAFLAGLALSGSRYAHQVFAEVLPLRDAFVAIFFTSIGLLLDPDVLFGAPALLAGLVAAVAMKALLIGAIVATVWGSWRLAVLSGLALAQIGEFSFVLADQGVAAGVTTHRFEQAFLGAAILTMSATPFLLRAARWLGALGADAPGDSSKPMLHDHVILVGCGSGGRAIARVLGGTGIPFVALDLLVDVVDRGLREDLPVRFGDGTRRAVLHDMGASRARAAVVMVGDPGTTRTVVALLRQLGPDMRILARARNVAEVETLEGLGADEVIPSEFETAIELLVRLLTHLGVPRHVARMQESIIRTERYRALRGLGTTAELLERTKQLVAGGILETACVLDGSAACGRTLAELDLRTRTGTIILSVVRNETPLPAPGPTTRLQAGDLLVVFGPHAAIARAINLFEPKPTEVASPG